MTVIVEFNPDTYDELFADVLVDYPGLLENLRQDFLEYAESDGERLPNYFGKVSAYMQPYAAMQAGLMHIHIAMPPDTFPEKLPQHDRKCSFNPQRDAALVYTQGELDDKHYSLIALLHPGAHGLASDPKVMNRLIAAAKHFRDQY